MHIPRKLFVGALAFALLLIVGTAALAATHTVAAVPVHSSGNPLAVHGALSSATGKSGVASVHTTPGNPPAADKTAIQYVDTHYPGSGKARVLATEPDVDRGVAVYDVRIQAPNGAIYVVHVQRSNNAVLWANRAENQAPTTSG
ncbi:MAG: hypothetical protein NVS3B14_03340 [Ktedonobacteraceae bacterium]